MEKMSSLSKKQSLSYLSGEYTLKILLAIVSNIVLATYLGPQNLGKLSFVLSFGFLFSHFAVFGTHELTIKELVSKKNPHALTMGSSFFVKLAGGSLGVLITFLLLKFFINESPQIEKLILILSSFQLIKAFDNIYDFFLSTLNIKRATNYRSIIIILIGIARILVAILTQNWVYIFYFVLLELVLLGLVYTFLYLKSNLSPLNWKLDFSHCYYFIKKSFPIFILTFLTFAILRTDQLMVTTLLSFSDNGHYSLATRFIEITLFIPLTISGVFFPSIVRETGAERTIEIRKLYSILSFTSFSFSICVTLFGPFLIKLIFGDRYEPAISPLIIYCWSGIFIHWNLARLKTLVARDAILETILSICFTFLLNLVLNYFLIKRMGIDGAAYASLLSFLAAFIICPIFSRKLREDTWDYLVSFRYLSSSLKKKSS
jgi:O-antigen/teichoic acid export membrane protein